MAILIALLLPVGLLAAGLKAVSQPAEDLQQFAGTYHLLGNQNLALEISASGSDLTLKERWSGREISFRQTAPFTFVAKNHPDFTLDFTRDQSGSIHQVTAFKKDIWLRTVPRGAGKKAGPEEAARINQAYQTIFPAFQEAINSNDTGKMQSFLTTYMDESLVNALTMERLVAQSKGLYQKTGGIALEPASPIGPDTGTATFKGKNQGNLFQMSFTLNQAGKIINFGLQE
ncbi:MAG: hypothetical protein ACO1O1_13595 [Adhaeribacter sp.]